MKRCTKCKSLMPDDVFLCIRCGFDDFRALEIDHIHGTGRTKKRRELSSHRYMAELRRDGQRFFDRYHLLCANCHHGMHRNRGKCPHLTRGK